MRIPFKSLALAALLFTLPLVSAQAREQAAQAAAPAPALAPGKYVWNPNAPEDGRVAIVVSLGAQLAYVYRSGALIGVSTISSGMPGRETPTGTFAILEKAREHRSNLYEDAPMPFMQRLTWDGVALHAGKVGPEPESHGCIRLPAGFAKRLFDVTALGARVVVTDEILASPEEALAALTGSPGAEVAIADETR